MRTATSYRLHQVLLAVVCVLATSCCGFMLSPSEISMVPQNKNRLVRTRSSISPLMAQPTATLTEETTWRLRFSLNGVPTKDGRKVGELFNVDVKFIEEEGYEPPQGSIQQILPAQEEDGSDSAPVQYLKVTGGRWQLSEDPEDRKDGLWVWGLFKEPLYPFMLLQIETEEYSLVGGDAIEPLKLYAQINHKRDKETGEVELEAATLNIREIESIKADPFGAAKVDIFEEVKCGQVSLRPLSQGSHNGAALL